MQSFHRNRINKHNKNKTRRSTEMGNLADKKPHYKMEGVFDIEKVISNYFEIRYKS